MSEIKNGTLGHYGTEHSKCNHMTKLGFKGLKLRNTPCAGTIKSGPVLFGSVDWTTVSRDVTVPTRHYCAAVIPGPSPCKCHVTTAPSLRLSPPRPR